MTRETSATEVAGPRETYGEHDDGGQRAERGDRTTRHFTIHHDGVTIPVSRGGRGRPLVLCPGLNSTQADLRELAELLRHDHDVVTFDLRGHGLAADHQLVFTHAPEIAQIIRGVEGPAGHATS
ncbi:alpha/beta fold hydrolase [Microbispora sp. H10836]|uniref:alpha/beta fold hydrolase n=1 Tax=Microbispora sp. H10836 TaxID=2729106 RepID=UPI0020163A25|nr:alpha/beta hydrolase [Microbispora sp. H10836]